jgi:hypothetical protein
MNFALTATPLEVAPELRRAPATLLVSTDPDRPDGALDLAAVTLAPGEALLVRL